MNFPTPTTLKTTSPQVHLTLISPIDAFQKAQGPGGRRSKKHEQEEQEAGPQGRTPIDPDESQANQPSIDPDESQANQPTGYPEPEEEPKEDPRRF